MKLNVSEFREALRKATINFSIESVQMEIKEDKASSKMIIQNSRDAIAILNIDNKFMDLKKGEEYTINFLEPSKTVIPYIGLIEEAGETDTDITFFDNKVIITNGKQESSIFFCAPQVVQVFSAEAPKSDVKYFLSFEIDDMFVNSFNKIKKIGARFGKVYFSVNSNKFFMETTDKSNPYSNSIKFELKDVKSPNLSLCFDYNNIVNVMSVIDNDSTAFKMSFTHREGNLGMISIEKSDSSEKYYLMSKLEA